MLYPCFTKCKVVHKPPACLECQAKLIVRFPIPPKIFQYIPHEFFKHQKNLLLLDSQGFQLYDNNWPPASLGI